MADEPVNPPEPNPQDELHRDNVIYEEDRHTQPAKAPWDGLIRDVLLFIVIVVLFRSLVFEPFHIPSGSMKGNLLVGDYLFVSKYSYGYSRFSLPFGVLMPFHGRVAEAEGPKRGDVVVFRPPGNPTVDFIKRVIGLPGDHIQMKEGRLYINGSPVPRAEAGTFVDDDDRSHAVSVAQFKETLPEGKVITVLKKRSDDFANNTQEYAVPKGHYFMMGDNRDESHDSRFLEDVGYVPEENLVGRAEIILFSLGIDNSGDCAGSWAERAPDGIAKPLYYIRQSWNCVWLRDGRYFKTIH